jgi:hypothetical protein
MRTLRLLILALVASASSARAQIESPYYLAPHPHPFVNRAEFLSRWGALLGAGVGIARTVANPNSAQESPFIQNAVIGAGIGLASGAVLATITRFETRGPKHRKDGLFAARLRDLSRYAGVGGNFGVGAGMISAQNYRRGETDLDTFFIRTYRILMGWFTGMAVGAVTWMVQH